MAPSISFTCFTTIQEISTGTVHFIYKPDTGNIITVGLAPNGFRLWFYTINGREQGDQTIQYTHRTLYLYGKIHVTGSIDDIEIIFFCIWHLLSLYQ